MLNTPMIQPWIFGVHVSHDAIPLNCRVVFDLLLKEVIGEARDGALGDLGCSELSFSCLDSDESNSFIRVTFPFRLYAKR